MLIFCLYVYFFFTINFPVNISLLNFAIQQVVDVGYASGIRAMRLTHVGEDGFILYIPAEVKQNFCYEQIL